MLKCSFFKTHYRFWASFNLLSSKRLIFRLPENPVTPSPHWMIVGKRFWTRLWLEKVLGLLGEGCPDCDSDSSKSTLHWLFQYFTPILYLEMRTQARIRCHYPLPESVEALLKVKHNCALLCNMWDNCWSACWVLQPIQFSTFATHWYRNDRTGKGYSILLSLNLSQPIPTHQQFGMTV